MKLDKIYAIKDKYRISEKTFFLISLFLGCVGVYAGMYTFRHKTKHMNFVIMVPVLFILNVMTIYFIFKYNIWHYFILFYLIIVNSI